MDSVLDGTPWVLSFEQSVLRSQVRLGIDKSYSINPKLLIKILQFVNPIFRSRKLAFIF